LGFHHSANHPLSKRLEANSLRALSSQHFSFPLRKLGVEVDQSNFKFGIWKIKKRLNQFQRIILKMQKAYSLSTKLINNLPY
jgi:hypothetical protein